jgi:hypothetical protein
MLERNLELLQKQVFPDINKYSHTTKIGLSQLKPYGFSKTKYHFILDVKYVRQYLDEAFPGKWKGQKETTAWVIQFEST